MKENPGTSALLVCAFLLFINASDTTENVYTIYAVKKFALILQPSENRYVLKYITFYLIIVLSLLRIILYLIGI